MINSSFSKVFIFMYFKNCRYDSFITIQHSFGLLDIDIQ